MNKKILTAAAALGFLAGGMVLGQAMRSDANVMKDFQVNGSTQKADAIYQDYVRIVESSKSAAQVSQVADEAVVRLEYIQTVQNAEIIRLLTEIKNKK